MKPYPWREAAIEVVDKYDLEPKHKRSAMWMIEQAPDVTMPGRSYCIAHEICSKMKQTIRKREEESHVHQR